MPSLPREAGPRPGPDILYAGPSRGAPADQRGRLARLKPAVLAQAAPARGCAWRAGGADERRVGLERVRGGRFARRPAAVRRSSCRAFARFVLGSPVFGGTTLRKLSVRYALARTARTRVELIRGRRVIRTLAGTRRVRAGRLRTLTLRPRTVRRGTYRVRLVIRRAGAQAQSVTLVTRRL